MPKTKLFIEKARAVHGDRYGYDRVVYFRTDDKVIITCAKHGDFEQAPKSHIRGSGCAKCGKESMAVKQSQKSKDGFIEKSRAKHGDRYDYSKAVYIHSKGKVVITCKIHGDFEQAPKNHIKGQGCVKCGVESIAANKKQKAKNRFVGKARAKHGDRYDYSKTAYVHSKEKVVITCKIHGDFEQTPSDHLLGKNCAKCSGKYNYSTQEWVQEAIDAHGDRYDYGHVVYVRCGDKVIITCKTHGDFEQTPNSHLNGQGCPSCPRRYDQPTNLYLMHNGLGKVKVGYAIDLNRRITELNSSAPFNAELLEAWTLPDTPTVRKIEGKVHRKLAKYHAGLSGFDGASEWFNTTPDRAKTVIIKALSGVDVLSYSNANSSQLLLF